MRRPNGRVPVIVEDEELDRQRKAPNGFQLLNVELETAIAIHAQRPLPVARKTRAHHGTFVLCNAEEEELEWRVPSARFGCRWRVVVDSATGFAAHDAGAEVDASVPLPVEGRSVVVLRQEAG